MGKQFLKIYQIRASRGSLEIVLMMGRYIFKIAKIFNLSIMSVQIAHYRPVSAGVSIRADTVAWYDGVAVVGAAGAAAGDGKHAAHSKWGGAGARGRPALAGALWIEFAFPIFSIFSKKGFSVNFLRCHSKTTPNLLRCSKCRCSRWLLRRQSSGSWEQWTDSSPSPPGPWHRTALKHQTLFEM